MLDINYIRENPDKVKAAANNRGYKVNIEELLKVDEERRQIIQQADEKRAEQKKLGKDDREAASKIKEEIKSLEKRLAEKNELYNILMADIPNIPLDSVPVGKDESENQVLRQVGEKTEFDFKPLSHDQLGEKLDIIDTERAAKVSGSRFGYIKNEGARLHLALVQWIIDQLTKKEFNLMLPPVMVKEEVMNAMGFLQHGGEVETYHFEKDNLYLIGTSEQSGLPYHMNEILDEKELPKKFLCYSTCFRREAGSYGKDVKGILRVHQFNKLEMLALATPDKSEKMFDDLLAIEEGIMQALGLPYQIVQLCTGDLNDSSANTIDIEAWFPSQDTYRETHSCSITTDFQTRRLNLRYKDKNNKNQFCHALNATAVTDRVMLSILENYQQKDGSVEIPKVLRPYMGKMKKIESKP